MQIASSWYHTVAMTASGDVYGTGHVEYGELGPVSFLQEKPAKDQDGVFLNIISETLTNSISIMLKNSS